MRTIKFRGKRLDNGKWEDGYVLFSQDNSEAAIVKLTDTESVCENVDPATVGQFTGLLDKNGKGIYEGDIVDFDNYLQSRSIVKFSDGNFRVSAINYETIFTFSVSRHTCVIGNIHDNPELFPNENV